MYQSMGRCTPTNKRTARSASFLFSFILQTNLIIHCTLSLFFSMQHSNHSHPLVHESLDLSNPSYWSAQSTHESNQPVQKQSSIRPKPLFIDTSFSSMLQSNGMSNGVNMDMIHTAPVQSHRASNVLLPAQTSPGYPQSPSSGDEFYQVTQKSAKRAAKNQAVFSDNVPMFIIQNPLVKLASVADSER